MTRVGVKRTVREISRRPPRLARAFLAETYDGIGQVVKVQMSQGAVTNALNARVAAGDFGGGRVFPVGTPVHVFSNRGKLEVFLGNKPGCIIDDSGAFDNFNGRTVAEDDGSGAHGWSTPSCGIEPYDYNKVFINPGSGQFIWLSVQDNKGRVRFKSGDTGFLFDFAGYNFINTAQVAPSPTTPGIFELAFMLDEIPGNFVSPDDGSTGSMTLVLIWTLVDTNVHSTVEVAINPNPPHATWTGSGGGGYVVCYGGGFGGTGTSYAAKTDWKPNVLYRLRAEINQEQTEMRVWLWEECNGPGDPIVYDIGHTGSGAGPFFLEGLNEIQLFTRDAVEPGWGLDGAGLSDFRFVDPSGATWPEFKLDFDYLTWSPAFELPPR